MGSRTVGINFETAIEPRIIHMHEGKKLQGVPHDGGHYISDVSSTVT